MKSFLLIVAVLLSFVVTDVAIAQEDFEAQRKVSMSYVLAFGGVSEELELSEEQSEDLTGSWISAEENLRDAFTKYQQEYSPRFSDEQKEQLLVQLKEDIEKVRETEKELLDRVLLPSQIKRLKEIQAQYFYRHHNQGVKMLNVDLELSQDQLSRIKDIRNKLFQTVRQQQANFSGRGGRGVQLVSEDPVMTRSELIEFVDEQNEKARKEVFDVLTTSQQQKLQELQGEKYVFETNRQTTKK